MVVEDGLVVVALTVVVVAAVVVVVVVLFVGATVGVGVVCILYNKFSMSFISKFNVDDAPVRVVERSAVLIAGIDFVVIFVGRCVVVVVVVVNALVTVVISFDLIPASSNDESKLHDKSSFSSEKPPSASSNRSGSGFGLSPPNDGDGTYRSLNDEKSESSNGSSTIVVRIVGCVLIILLLRIVVND